ncbi:MAG: hypothetical protein QM610_05005 [Chitinophagaceae bacterium]
MVGRYFDVRYKIAEKKAIALGATTFPEKQTDRKTLILHYGLIKKDRKNTAGDFPP